MEKLPMCRICLAEDVRMYLVVTKDLHELYERLTCEPFVTKDSRPILACYLCCAELKRSFRLLKRCLQAEELFAQIINGNYKQNRLINRFPHGFIISPIQNINIVEVGATESVVVKEELPAVCERQDDIPEPKKEYQGDDLELGNLDNSLLDVGDILPHDSEPDSKNDILVMEYKIEEEEEQEAFKEECRAVDTNGTPAKPIRRSKDDLQEDYLTADHFHFIDENVVENGSNRISTLANKNNNIHNTIDSSNKEEALDENKQVCKENASKHRHNCEHCQKTFLNTRYLKEHINRQHNTVWKYNCEYCLYKSNQIYPFKLHVGKHTNTFKFACDKCPFKTNYGRNFRKHCIRHEDTLPSYSSKSNFLSPKTCDKCSFKSCSRKVFATHMSKHKGNIYRCDKCPYSNHSKYNLSRHVTRLGH